MQSEYAPLPSQWNAKDNMSIYSNLTFISIVLSLVMYSVATGIYGIIYVKVYNHMYNGTIEIIIGSINTCFIFYILYFIKIAISDHSADNKLNYLLKTSIVAWIALFVISCGSLAMYTHTNSYIMMLYSIIFYIMIMPILIMLIMLIIVICMYRC